MTIAALKLFLFSLKNKTNNKNKTKENKKTKEKNKKQKYRFVIYHFLELSFQEKSCQKFWLRASKKVLKSRRNNKIVRYSFVSGCLKALMKYSPSSSTGRRSCEQAGTREDTKRT